MNNKLFCDVLISGAGIVGSSLAIRLAQSGIKVIIIDQKYPPLLIKKDNDTPPMRGIAINHITVQFFKSINVWQKIPSDLYTSYHQLETWEWLSAKVIFHAESVGLKEMGCIIENNRLQSALWESFIDYKKIQLYCPSTLIKMNYDGSFWRCILDSNTIIISRLLIGADGIYSQVRKKLGINVTGWEYHQYCMLLTIKTEKCKYGTVWQIFKSTGPIGFLPLYDNWGLLMWYDSPSYIRYLQKLPYSFLEKKIEDRFKKQLGCVKLYKLVVVAPLISQSAYNYVALGGALVGDAAHTIHPLAGQGINLGIRDIICLSELLINSHFFDSNDSLEKILQSYQNYRKYDAEFMQTSINWLYFIFHNDYLPFKIFRNCAFMAFEQSVFLKKQVLKYALGLHS